MRSVDSHNSHHVLSLEGISESFAKTKKSGGFKVLDDVDIEVERGKITAIIGSNGAGKTTLFNIISGFLAPDAGTIHFFPNGTRVPLKKMLPHKIAQLGIGRLFQENHLFPNLSLLDNMTIADDKPCGEGIFQSVFRRAYLKQREKEKQAKALGIFSAMFPRDDPFTYRKDEYFHTLSYGQQRLLALLRLFMGDYRLLLLDEPTAGVNIEIIKQMATIIRRMAGNGDSILLIEHNWEFVLQVADFCYFLDEGKVAAMGTPDDVLGNPTVRARYLGR